VEIILTDLSLAAPLTTLDNCEPEQGKVPAGKRIRRRRKHQKKVKTSDKSGDETAAICDVEDVGEEDEGTEPMAAA
jgi:hypothetical protein